MTKASYTRPATGVVNTRFVDPGEFVGRGAPVINLVNISKVEVDVSVPELDVKYLKTGASVPLKVDALPEHTFMGAIEFISMKADPHDQDLPDQGAGG